MKSRRPILINDLQSFNKLSYINNIEDIGSPILSGLFEIQDFHNGIIVHASDATESRTTNIVSEIPAGISFTFLFSGEIDFSLGNHQYRIQNQCPSSATCSFIVANQPEIFTRHLKDGMHIKKLNVFVEQNWLLRRCQSAADKQIVCTLFNHPGMYKWQPNIACIEQAKTVLELNSLAQQTLSSSLTSEHATLALLTTCLDQAYQCLQEDNQTSNYTVALERNSLKSRVDLCLEHCQGLPEIATHLNISVSTLQRHFKRDYGMNISSYIKQRRLTIARRSLLTGSLSIGEVAFDAGYQYVSNFIHAFKKQFGLTPAAFIKVHRPF